MYFYPPKTWNIGPAKIAFYGTFMSIGIGFFIAVFLILLKKERFQIKWRNFIWVFLAGGLLFGLGAYGWDHLCHFLGGDGTQGGISFLGGVVFGLPLFYLILVLVYPVREQRIAVMNFIFPAVAIGHAFGRIGCFFGGCCYGLPTEGFGVIYDSDSLAAARYYDGVSVFPIQLVESLFLFGLFFFLLFFKKKQFRMEAYCLGYGVARFIIEFFRGDNRGAFLPFLSPSQFLSILLIAFAIIHLILLRKYPYRPLEIRLLETKRMRNARLPKEQAVSSPKAQEEK